MSEELLINVCMREVRAALVENGVLQELFIERAGGRGLVGNIYKGRVMRVLPGLQASFVNVGLERSAFLHAADIVRGLEEEPAGQDRRLNIDTLVSEGDELLVQILKDPLGGKGARLTTFITLPSRLLVLAPGGSGRGGIGPDRRRSGTRTAAEPGGKPHGGRRPRRIHRQNRCPWRIARESASRQDFPVPVMENGSGDRGRCPGGGYGLPGPAARNPNAEGSARQQPGARARRLGFGLRQDEAIRGPLHSGHVGRYRVARRQPPAVRSARYRGRDRTSAGQKGPAEIGWLPHHRSDRSADDH